jgi:hypothetical protein
MVEYGYAYYLLKNQNVLQKCNMSIESSLSLSSPSPLDGHFVFTFVRNPYIRFISSYLFLLSIPSTTMIDGCTHFVLKLSLWQIIQKRNDLNGMAYSHMFDSQCKNLDIDNIRYDFIGKCEDNVQSQLCQMMTQWEAIPEHIIPITHKDKVNFTIKEKPFYLYYNDDVFQFVNTWFDNDFTRFGYHKYATFPEFLRAFSP